MNDRVDRARLKRLLDAYISARDDKTRNAVVEGYMYIADVTAARFAGRGAELDDLRQTGYMALIKAVERFDASVGADFATYATSVVVGEIRNYFRDKTRMIRLPHRYSELYRAIDRYRTQFYADNGAYPTQAAIAEALNIPADLAIEIIERYGAASVQSLEGISQSDDDERAFEPASDEGGYASVELKDFIEREIDSMSPLERDVIKARFYDNRTQSDVARQLNVSQMYVSRLERRLLQRMRQDYSES